MSNHPESQKLRSTDKRTHLSRAYGFWPLIAMLAWAPFPLGSNREWSWGALMILTAICWSLWIPWAEKNASEQWSNLKRIRIPLLLGIATLIWACVQILPVVPNAWIHPLWGTTASLLDQKLTGSITINTWKTSAEIMKLLTYMAVAWLAYSYSNNNSRAKVLLNAIIAIGSAYALYAFSLGLLGIDQYSFFYSIPLSAHSLSGPFVSRNSFAAFEALAAIASVSRFVELAHNDVILTHGIRRGIISLLKFILGSGSPMLIATILTTSAIIASASRGVFVATISALLIMGITFVTISKTEKPRRLIITVVMLVISVFGILFFISGDPLIHRIEFLISADRADQIRPILWTATERMILSSPLMGLGLGSFEDAYPMYASRVIPFIIDKAHCDLLEFAAGVGIPAALSWWSAIIIVNYRMISALRVRRRNRIFPFIAVAATIALAIHSAVDFSLQMPAIAISYAAILGLGIAQSTSGRIRNREIAS